MKKAAILIPAAVAVALGFTGTASAHHSTSSAACVQGAPQGQVDAEDYPAGSRARVYVDGTLTVDQMFNGNFIHQYALGSPTAGHRFRFRVTSSDGQSNFDQTSEVPACQIPSSSTVVSTTAPPTTTPSTTSGPVSTTVPAGSSTTVPTSSSVEPSTSSPTTSAAPTTTNSPTGSSIFIPPSTGNSTVTSTVPQPSTPSIASTVAGTSPEVAVAAPPVPSTPSAGLPVTGSATWPTITLAMGALIAGAGLITITRRKARG